MPELSYEALTILLVLLPGFLTAGLVSVLCSRPRRSELDKVIEALLYSFIVYVVYASVRHSFPVALVAEPVPGKVRYSLEVRSGSLLVLTAVSLVVAVMVAAMVTHDFPLSLLRKARITQRTLRTSVWSDAFHTVSGYVQVGLADGRQVLGWLRYYSETPEEASLFLEDAAWVDPEKGELIQIKGAGILLAEGCTIQTVMFLDAKADTGGEEATKADK